MKKIDWILLNNGEEIICLKDYKCEFINNKLTLIEETNKNIINLDNKVYTRITEEYTMKIDFKDKTCNFEFENKENFICDLECEMVYNKEKIEITYKFDQEIFKIKITMKEE